MHLEKRPEGDVLVIPIEELPEEKTLKRMKAGEIFSYQEMEKFNKWIRTIAKTMEGRGR
jgi:hypothetical protein